MELIGTKVASAHPAARNAYAEHGWLCIVLTSVQFDHLHDTVEQIVRVMGQRGWRPPPPSL